MLAKLKTAAAHGLCGSLRQPTRHRFSVWRRVAPVCPDTTRAGKLKPAYRGSSGLRAATMDPQQVKETFLIENDVDSARWDDKYGEQYGILDYGVSIMQGPRDTLEDTCGVTPRGRCGFLFAGVFDGHGGALSAEYLSTELYRFVSERLDEADSQSPDWKRVLQAAFAEADKQLLKFLQEEGDEDDQQSGATATIVLVRRDKLVVANVGDSRAVLGRASGTELNLSAEHRVYGTGPSVNAEIERVQSVGGWVEDGRVCDVLAVSRAFGDMEFKGKGLQAMLQRGVDEAAWTQEFADSVKFTGDPVISVPEVTEVDLASGEGEFVIVATDGLWDVVTSRDAAQWTRKQFTKGATAQQVADSLVHLAAKRYTADNVGVVVVDLKGREGWGSPRKGFRWGW